MCGRTNNSLRVLCTTRAEAEFAELGFGVGGDGVEACFGGLSACKGCISEMSQRHGSMSAGHVPWRMSKCLLLCKG
jgi:hypothetical protein